MRELHSDFVVFFSRCLFSCVANPKMENFLGLNLNALVRWRICLGLPLSNSQRRDVRPPWSDAWYVDITLRGVPEKLIRGST